VRQTILDSDKDNNAIETIDTRIQFFQCVIPSSFEALSSQTC